MSAVLMKALANEADKQRRQILAAATLADEQLCRGENEGSPSTTAAIVAAEQVGREVAELALVIEQERREAAERASALATVALALATALKCREVAGRTSVLAILMLANVRKRQQAAEHAQMSANIVSPNEVQCGHSGDTAIERIRMEFALCAAPLDAILAQPRLRQLCGRSPVYYGGGHTTVFAPCSLPFCSRACGSTMA